MESYGHPHSRYTGAWRAAISEGILWVRKVLCFFVDHSTSECNKRLASCRSIAASMNFGTLANNNFYQTPFFALDLESK